MVGSGSPLGINERKEIKRLLGKMSMTKIAERMNRSKNCVITEVRNNGGAEEYDPVKAHQRANDVQKEGRARANLLNALNIQLQDAKRAVNSLHEARHECRELKEELRQLISQAKGMNQLLPMIQALDQRIVKLEEKTDELSNVKPLYIRKVMSHQDTMKKRLKDLEDKLLAPKPCQPTKLIETPQRLIKATEWRHYHDWPHSEELMKLIRERETNGMGDACLKVGKRWMVDEVKFIEWSKSYKEALIKQAKGE